MEGFCSSKPSMNWFSHRLLKAAVCPGAQGMYAAGMTPRAPPWLAWLKKALPRGSESFPLWETPPAPRSRRPLRASQVSQALAALSLDRLPF